MIYDHALAVCIKPFISAGADDNAEVRALVVFVLGVPVHTFKGGSCHSGALDPPSSLVPSCLSIPAIRGAALFSLDMSSPASHLLFETHKLNDMPTQRKEGFLHSSSPASLSGHYLEPLWTNPSFAGTGTAKVNSQIHRPLNSLTKRCLVPLWCFCSNCSGWYLLTPSPGS